MRESPTWAMKPRICPGGPATRIEEKVVPLESERARAAYGLPEGFRTFPSKVLIFNREVQVGRVKMVIVEEPLGF